MERKELLKSQQELIRLKIGQVNAAQTELQATLNIVATELGIDVIKELWKLTSDGVAFEKVEQEKRKEPKPLIPGKRKEREG